MPPLLQTVQAWGLPVTPDVLLIFLFAGASLVYGLVIGRDRSVMLLCALYLALAVVTNTPLLLSLNQTLRVYRSPALQMVWFISIFLLVFWILARSRFFTGMARDKGPWWEAVLYAFLQLGLTVSTALFLLPPASVARWPEGLKQVFLGDLGRSFWLLAPLVAFAFLDRKREVWIGDDEE